MQQYLAPKKCRPSEKGLKPKAFNAKRKEGNFLGRYDAIDALEVIYDEFAKIESYEIIQSESKLGCMSYVT